MPKINIVGESALFELDDVKNTVIHLGGKWFFKHDSQNLVKVKTDKGIRLFRKESKLIVQTANETHVLKSKALVNDEGVFFDPNSSDTIIIDGKPTLSKWAVKINSKWYLKTDPQIVRTRNGNYELLSRCVKLAERYYGPNTYETTEDPDNLVLYEDEYYLRGDCREVIRWDAKTEQIVSEILPSHIAQSKRLRSGVFKDFKDRSNPQLGRYDTAYAEVSDVVESGVVGAWVLSGMQQRLEQQISELIYNQKIKKYEEIRKRLNACFGDLDETENTAKTFSLDYQTWGGKQTLFGEIHRDVISTSLQKTGGIGYSFGVEIETSAGLVPHNEAHKLGVLAVGDRSIGSAEYVTPVLHGNDGIDFLEQLCRMVNEHCLVDDRCSIHVHVGSAQSLSSRTSCWPLRFDRRFAIAAIKLGTLIEEDLYRMLPKGRHPYNRHCYSIRRYDNINEENYAEFLGSFVFGPEERFNTILDMRHYKYGTGNCTKESSLPTWCGSRYKWLNLVRAYSRCSAGRTIELRIWNASTNFEKIYNFVLLSLAFVYVADHYYKDIMAGNMNLEKMVRLAFVRHDHITERLLKFIADRQAKFNRKVIYDKIPLSKIQSITSQNAELTGHLEWVINQ